MKKRAFRYKGTGERRQGVGIKRFFSFGLVLLIFTAALGVSPNVAAAADAPVSPALYILAEENRMAMAGISGSSIDFEKEDFLRTLNLSSIEKITVVEAPPVSDGELRLGSTVVTSGKEIRVGEISELSYYPSSAVSESEFKFRADGASCDMTCKLYMLDRANFAPTVSTTNELSVNVSTYRNVKYYGSLSVYDPEGDDVRIDVVSYPRSGYIEFTDRARGEYVFVPNKDFSGKDSFTYVATDKYGNYSAAATVSLNVKKPANAIVYHDMADAPQYSAAIAVTEAGVMSGAEVGSKTFFYPDATLTRGEFTVMALHAAGIESGGGASYKVFADSKDIPEYMRPYVSAAYDLGYIDGIEVDGKYFFEPNRKITVAEAAVLLGNIVNAPVPTLTPSFSDGEDIPVWAAPSVYALCGIGIMPLGDGDSVSANEALTRGDAAVYLANLMAELD